MVLFSVTDTLKNMNRKCKSKSICPRKNTIWDTSRDTSSDSNEWEKLPKQHKALLKIQSVLLFLFSHLLSVVSLCY